MPRNIKHIIERNGTNVGADAVSDAGVPVYRNVGSVDSKFGWGVNGSPYFVSVMFVYNLAFSLKIRVNRQKTSPFKLG
jgi:hypothetical protein